MALYAVHVQGPDEIVAAPSEREAQALADRMQAFFAERFKNDSPGAPLIDVAVIKWPYSPSAHAEELAKDWAAHAKFIGPIDPEPERDTRTIDMFGEL